MGQPDQVPPEPPDDRPPGDAPPVEARLLRARDLVDLRLEAPGCTVEPTAEGAELVAGADASLVVHFPPQHVGEEVFLAEPPPPASPPAPGRASRHIAANPSRLVYAVPAGTRIDYTLEGVLGALPTLQLRVASGATPAGEVGDADVTPPTGLETAIEAPYHLVVSPSRHGAFRHSAVPIGPDDRVELWRTHLSVRKDDGTLDDDDAGQRTVRALWNRDGDEGPPLPRQPLAESDRRQIVEQTSGPSTAATPLQVDHLSLSSLGAWFDWHQTWDFTADLVDYRHQAHMGRDTYVRTAYPGLLFPFGHRCVLVKVTERDVKHRDDPVAHLWQRLFIVLRQPTRRYPADRDNPFEQVTLGPLVTPDLDTPPDPPFVPARSGVPFPFTLTTVDRGGGTRSWAAPLVFVQAGRGGAQDFQLAASRYLPVRHIAGRGQTLAVAPPFKAGDTSVEVRHLVFGGELGADSVTCRPFLTSARAVVPSMRHLAPQAPAVDLAFARAYLDHGLPERPAGERPVPGTPNAGEVILAVTSAPVAVDFSNGSDRAGGFISPNLSVKGISRMLGAVGDSGGASSALAAGTFDPASLLAGALPKLFGLFSLLELLEAVDLDDAPAFVSDALDAVTRLLTEAQRMRAALDQAQTRLADEVANAAHGGARAIAQQAQDALEARVGDLRQDLGDLIAALRDRPGDLDGVQAAARALAGDVQPLLDALGAPGVPAAVRSALVKPVQTLTTLTDIAENADRVKELLERAVAGQVTARLRWQPRIRPWGPPGIPGVFQPGQGGRGLLVDVEVRASATAAPVVDVLAELADFRLNLMGAGNGALMGLRFRRVAFHAGSAGKPEVDVVFGGLEFLGPLSFVDRLRELIPFDGFSDPPYVDVAPSGVTAGFDLTLPNVAVGVFSLENIALGADARVPFLGDAMTVGFRFCSKDAPFRLTVMAVGGGGWLGLRASPKGLVLLELGLEAAASLSVDLGVASGSVSIAVGVYLRLEADAGLLTAYFRIRGQVRVLGLASASITLELSLTYHFPTGKLLGRASLVVEVEVLFFSASVEIVVERRLAGSKGDPTMHQVMPPDDDGLNADWTQYCGAFAPLPT